MSVVLANVGLQEWAENILGQKAASAWLVRLWINFYTPTPNDVLATYTACSWPGYSDFGINPSQWVPSGSGSQSPWTYPLITFTFDPSGQPQQTVFGYLVYNGLGTLLYSEAFSAPYPISPQGGSLPLQLFWQDKQC